MKPSQYKAKPIRWMNGASKSKGTEFVAVLFEITEGPDRGEKIRADLYWTEKTEERTTKALKLLGWQGQVDENMELVGLVNVVPIGVVEETKNNGAIELKVDWVGESPSAGIDDSLRLPASNAREFVLAMRRRAGFTNGRAAPPALPAPEPGDDDDVPY